MKTFKQYSSTKLVEAKDEINYKNLVRYIPTGSTIKTSIGQKSIKIMVIKPISAPPLTTKDIPGAEKRLLKDVDSFINDVEKVIKIKKVEKDTYVFIKGVDKGIELIYEFSILVGTAAEVKKLIKLDDAMAFYK